MAEVLIAVLLATVPIAFVGLLVYRGVLRDAEGGGRQ